MPPAQHCNQQTLGTTDVCCKSGHAGVRTCTAPLPCSATLPSPCAGLTHPVIDALHRVRQVPEDLWRVQHRPQQVELAARAGKQAQGRSSGASARARGRPRRLAQEAGGMAAAHTCWRTRDAAALEGHGAQAVRRPPLLQEHPPHQLGNVGVAAGSRGAQQSQRLSYDMHIRNAGAALDCAPSLSLGRLQQ